VLVVEDSEDVREALEAFLESRNYRVVACDRTESALAAMRNELPDLVLTDIFLGPSSGLDMITAILSDFAEPPPIIACSGMKEVEPAALARGADLFLPKPLVPEKLEPAVAALIDARAPGRQLVDEYAARSRELRERNVDAAREARNKIETHIPLLEEQARRDARWLPTFLGSDDCIFVTIQDGRLLVAASSNPRRWPRGGEIEQELPICRDIVETGSTFLVPDLTALVPKSNSEPARPRFVAAFPFSYHGVPVGALCLIGDQPGHLDPADFALVGQLCGHLSDWLSDDHRPEPRGSTLMKRRSIEIAIHTEFERAARLDLTVHLFVFASRTTPSDLFAERTMVADLGDGRFGMMMTRPTNDSSPRDLVAAIDQFRGLPGFEGGDLLSIEVSAAPRLGNDILGIAERRFDERRARSNGPSVERIVLRHEPLMSEPLVQAS
jgi:DNA-binding response OmpR family regulator